MKGAWLVSGRARQAAVVAGLAAKLSRIGVKHSGILPSAAPRLIPEHESETAVPSRQEGAVKTQTQTQTRLPLLEYSPDSGSYILLSRGRRRRGR
jgi:hypothetical protein